MRRFPRVFLAALLLAAALPSPAAEAVIPSAFGPIQALIVILPQLLLALAAAMLALFKPRTYKVLGAWLWSHKAFTLAFTGVFAFMIWGPPLGRGAVTKEQSGTAWVAHRGGPQRTGVVPGSKGPGAAARIAWRVAPGDLGPVAWVDSSPAIVGNRLFATVGNPAFLGEKWGSVVCVDTDTGALAWTWTGKGELQPRLKPVFSSPVVSVEGAPPAARHVVFGEGYHEDQNCRFVCLDLAPKEGPKLHWALQTTSHVESTPCLHEGRAYIGAGDDGVWCVEIAAGRVLWRIEGAPFLEVAGPKASELSKFAGKTVVATGTATRENLGAKGKDDPGVVVLDIASFREHSGPAETSGPLETRTVTGKVAVPAQGRTRIEFAVHNPDSESPPLAIATTDGRRVLFGSGLSGQRVTCADADTGEIKWVSPTPFPAFGSPTVAGGRVLLGVGNGNFLESDPNPAGAVVCLSLADGRELWRVPLPDNVIGAVAVVDDRAYACCRDGHVHVIDVARGAPLAKFAAAAPMASSPAVTADAVYVATNAGKIIAFDRASGALRWSVPLSPGTAILSSPTVAHGRVYATTRGRGIVALAEAPRSRPEAARPWTGPGGDAGRTSCADDFGLPRISGDIEARSSPFPGVVAGPVAASGSRIFAAFEQELVCIDGPSGRVAWKAPVRALDLRTTADRILARDAAGWRAFDFDGKPATADPPVDAVEAYDLRFSVEERRLVCRTPVDGSVLWSADAEGVPVSPPTVASGRVFVALARESKGELRCHRITDGSLLWKQPIDEPPNTHVVANDAWACVGYGKGTDGAVAVHRASDGSPRESAKIAGTPVAPALCGDVLVLGGGERIAAWDILANDYPWKYKDEAKIGTATSPPVISNGAVWVGTDKMGLVVIGPLPGARP